MWHDLMMIFLVVLPGYICLLLLAMRCGFERRQLLGFILAPLAPCVLGAVIAEDPVAIVILAPFSYALTLVGIPVYLVFRAAGWLRVWQIVPTTTLLGGLIAFATGLSKFANRESWVNALLFAEYGAVAGLAFWIVAFFGRKRVAT